MVNVSASLVAAATLIVVAFLASGKLTALLTDTATHLTPIGLATVLLGFFLLVTRRKAVSQIVGLLLIDNGVALIAFLLTAGVPLIVELGASLDVLLVVVVLRCWRRRCTGARALRPRSAPRAARLMLLYAILSVPLAAGLVAAFVPWRAGSAG